MNASAPFSARVYAAARKIPRGKVATYGQIAQMAGKPRAARAVGTLMRKNKSPEHCPCHRVVGHAGALVGYGFGGVGEKRKRLIDEGVSFAGAKVNLQKSLWRPTRRRSRA
ncbi:MAG TPA: MGMT family protein [Candidatus Paceibacterota bacterium]|nr:MGMT family protein [Candidatus Paceibacterota bacterium]